MARTAVPLTPLGGNAFTARPTGTTADPTNDHVIDISDVPLEEIIVEFTQTDATGRAATVLAGDNPPALEAGQGDSAQTMAQNAVYYWAGNSSRFRQSDSGGQLFIDLGAGFAGTIRAYRLPRNV